MISKRGLHSELNFSRKEAVGRRNSPAVVEESVDSHYLRKDTSPNIFNEVVSPGSTRRPACDERSTFLGCSGSVDFDSGDESSP